MRKIDKTCALSTAYLKWQANLGKTAPYPKYNSSNNEYYLDIVTQLLYCQRGLCAYTEQFLAEKEVYNPSHWAKGRYQSPKPEFEGQLEHFDESKKAKKADKHGIADWEWDNFFLVADVINTKVKGTKAVDNILKPDAVNYDPLTKLAYNPATHRYSPHTDLSPQDHQRVKFMIKTLGLNFGPVIRKRREILKYALKKNQDLTSSEILYEGQFPTAYSMTIIAQQAGQDDSILSDFL
ncbi:MAG: hypothetical protein AB8E82_05720 [Aureispira sp.]